jgi:hypothetical protein
VAQPKPPWTLQVHGNDASVTRGLASPHQTHALKPSQPGASHRQPRRPCHYRAISNSLGRSPADNHGHITVAMSCMDLRIPR